MDTPISGAFCYEDSIIINQLKIDLSGQAKARQDLGRIITQKDTYIRKIEADLKLTGHYISEAKDALIFGNADNALDLLYAAIAVDTSTEWRIS